MSKSYIYDSSFQTQASNTNHFITTTRGGVSTGNYNSMNLGLYCGEAPSITQENYGILASQLGISTNRIFVPREIHSNQVAVIDEKTLSMDLQNKVEALSQADALITKLPGVAVTVSTADCVPIICTDNKTFVAAIHAGWRGIISDVIDSTLQKMEILGCNLSDLSFLVGPCISGESYEVDIDVWSKFRDHFTQSELETILTKQTKHKYYPDLRTAATVQILKYVEVNKIFQLKADTFTDSHFYSVRRSGAKTGRFLTGIMLKG